MAASAAPTTGTRLIQQFDDQGRQSRGRSIVMTGLTGLTGHLESAASMMKLARSSRGPWVNEPGGWSPTETQSEVAPSGCLSRIVLAYPCTLVFVVCYPGTRKW